VETPKLHEAETHLLELVEAVKPGEEVIITRHGEPVAKLVGLAATGRRELGFYPLDFKSDLLEPTDDDVTDAFYSR